MGESEGRGVEMQGLKGRFISSPKKTPSFPLNPPNSHQTHSLYILLFPIFGAYTQTFKISIAKRYSNSGNIHLIAFHCLDMKSWKVVYREWFEAGLAVFREGCWEGLGGEKGKRDSTTPA